MLRKITLLTFLSCLSFFSQAQNKKFTVFSVDVQKSQVELFLHDASGKTFKNFDSLNKGLQKQHKKLQFAMNAGVYHKDFSPVGLLVLNGKQMTPLNQAQGQGNFFLKPNGVFLMRAKEARILEPSEYANRSKDVRFATQSGPLLLKNGSLHSAFHQDSKSRLIRNGVGVLGHTVYFVISEKPVNFYEFAVFFRDNLHCKEALYLDGVVSSIYSEALHRNDKHAELGPILGVLE